MPPEKSSLNIKSLSTTAWYMKEPPLPLCKKMETSVAILSGEFQLNIVSTVLAIPIIVNRLPNHVRLSAAGVNSAMSPSVIAENIASPILDISLFSSL